AGAGGGDFFGKIRETARAITNDRGESTQTAVGDETAFNYATENVWIDIATAKEEHAFFAGEIAEFSGEASGKRCCGGSFNYTLFELDQSQNRDCDLLFGHGDGEIDMLASD